MLAAPPQTDDCRAQRNELRCQRQRNRTRLEDVMAETDKDVFSVSVSNQSVVEETTSDVHTSLLITNLQSSRLYSHMLASGIMAEEQGSLNFCVLDTCQKFFVSKFLSKKTKFETENFYFEKKSYGLIEISFLNQSAISATD